MRLGNVEFFGVAGTAAIYMLPIGDEDPEEACEVLAPTQPARAEGSLAS